MSNIQLARAADLIDRPVWKSTAIRRMTSEAPKAFSKLGISFEQSSGYQLTNATLWQQAADLLAETPGSAGAGRYHQQDGGRCETGLRVDDRAGWEDPADR